MKKLNIQIPQWNFKREARVSLNPQNGKEYLTFNGVDTNNNPYDIFNTVHFKGETCNKTMKLPLRDKEMEDDTIYKIGMTFQGHYQEPKLEIAIPR